MGCMVSIDALQLTCSSASRDARRAKILRGPDFGRKTVRPVVAGRAAGLDPETGPTPSDRSRRSMEPPAAYPRIETIRSSTAIGRRCSGGDPGPRSKQDPAPRLERPFPQHGEPQRLRRWVVLVACPSFRNGGSSGEYRHRVSRPPPAPFGGVSGAFLIAIGPDHYGRTEKSGSPEPRRACRRGRFRPDIFNPN